MGSAVLAHSCGKGRRVLGLEQFPRGHELGASSGRSRIIRKAYFEDAAYVPLLVRAYELWRQLEEEVRTPITDLRGVLVVGDAQNSTISGIRKASAQYSVPVEEFDAAGIARRFRGTTVYSHEVGVYEPEAGIVFPERAILAHYRMAEARGAELRFDAKVSALHTDSRCIYLTMADGTTIKTGRLAICAGPWTSQVLSDLKLPLRVQRNVQIWFRSLTSAFQNGQFPVFVVERDHWPARLYGFPDLGDGVKAAFHAFGEFTDASRLDRTIRQKDIAPVRRALEDWAPGAAAEFAFGKACMYALTPDENFIVDRHPADGRIIIAAGFSGHGFKFCPVVGEIVSELAFEGGSRHPISFLGIDRFNHAR
jgi:sarcosine oxidase